MPANHEVETDRPRPRDRRPRDRQRTPRADSHPAAGSSVRSWIAHKRDGGALDEATIRRFINGVAAGTIPDYQITALLMAVLWRGLDEDELLAWTSAMVASGERLDLGGVPGPHIDKHSTGGVCPPRDPGRAADFAGKAVDNL